MRRPSMSFADLLAEAWPACWPGPARVALTVLGTVVGVAALVATLGLSKTASQPDRGPLRRGGGDRHRRVARPSARVDAVERAPFRAEESLRRLNGVVAAGRLSDVDVHGDLVGLGSGQRPAGPVAASSSRSRRRRRVCGGPCARTCRTGRFPDAGHSARADRVAVLGLNAAAQLNINRVDQQPAIFLGDRLYLVVGILDRVERQPSLLGSIVMPEGTAVREYGLRRPGLAQIETRVGAVPLIARQAPIALSPERLARS